MKKWMTKEKIAVVLVSSLVTSAVMMWWLNLQGRALATTPAGDLMYVRSNGMGFDEVIGELGEKGVVAHPQEFVQYAKFMKKGLKPQDGTYEFKPGMTFDEVVASLRKPVNQMVRLPEGWWIARTAKRLEEKGVCTAQEYIELANQPEEFKSDVSFAIPKDSLEGYLYPDTYDLPPLLGARGVIKRQLQNFEKKVSDVLKVTDLHRALTVGSLIETEVAVDIERPIVAGVIENRIKQRMRLQLDATALYAIQEWKQFKAGEISKIESPYNTYKVFGLPPGPICSPTIKSIEAALSPASHDYLYYVRGKGMTHLFGRTYEEHLVNIRKSNEFRKLEAAG